MDREPLFNPGRDRRRLRVGALLSVTVLLTASGLAQGIETGPEIQIRGSAMGIGAHFVFSRPGTAPMEPVFDVTFGSAGGGHDQLSNQNFGFAASFYPGNTPATPGSLLGLAGFPIGGQILPPEHPIHQGYSSLPGLIPPWPLATQGSYPGNPGRRVDLLSDVTGTIPAPLPVDLQGMTQETVVDEDVVTAVTNVDLLSVSSLGTLNPEFEPLVEQLDRLTKPHTGEGAGVRGSSFTLRGLNARYESVNTGDAARSTAEVTVREVELFGGLLEFFRVRSFVEYAGSSEEAKLTRHFTEVGLARVLGLDVIFDDRGMKLADRRIPAGQGAAVTGVLGEILTKAGITVETTSAKVDGNKVEEVALRVVIAEQEPTLPGTTFFGRKTTVTFEVGALASNFEILAGASAAGGNDLGSGGLGASPDLEVALPAAGPGSTRAAAETPAREEKASSPVPTVLGRRPSASGRGPRPAVRSALSFSTAAEPVVPATDDPAETEVAAPGPETAAAPAAPPGRVLRRSKAKPSDTPLLLLPGVLASDAEQREIAAGIADIGRRMVLLAGIGAAGGLVVWRRRKGFLR